MFLRFLGAVFGGLAVCLVAAIGRSIYVSVITGILVFFEAYFFSGLYDYRYLVPQHLFVSYKTLTEGEPGRVVGVSLAVIVLMLIVILAFNNERSRRRLV